MINDELIVQTLAVIERDPARHDQGLWIDDTECGTVCCFAGHAVHTVSRIHRLGTSHMFRTPDGRMAHVADVAADLLGIGPLRGDSPAGRLFYGCDTLDDLYAVCADILGVDEVVLRDKVHAVVFPDQPL